ncbi:MAG: type III-A CRISPR-associated RAMP protein Csm5 [Vallitalea sp.]|nr:type III-A CRISPR-associated RAMP protein Csm5 [Vallitalea sp.]
MVNKQERIKITVLSPVHIGNGDVLSPYTDFIINNGRIVILDSQKLFEKIEPHVMEKYLQRIKKTKSNNSNKYTLSKLIYENNIDYTDCEITESEFIYSNKQSEIQMHIKTKDQLYIPGSSIKGAIRTTMMYDIHNQIQGCKKKNRLTEKKELELINKLDNHNNIMNIFSYNIGLKDAYIEKLDNVSYTNSLLYNMKKSDEDREQNHIYSQCIDVGCQLSTTISFYKNLDNRYDILRNHIDANVVSTVDLFKIINNFYYSYIEDEIQELSYTKDLNNVKDRYNKLIEHINKSRNNNKSCVLRIGSYKTKRNHIVYEKDNIQSITRNFIVDENDNIIDVFGWVKLERID